MQFITYFKNALTLPTHGSKLFLLSFILLFSSFLSTAFSAEETEQILLDLRNIIDEQNGQEQNKVKSIGIFCYKDERITPWDPDSIHSGIAGSEEAVIYLSQELAKLGCQVTVFAQPPSASPHSLPEANPRYVAADYAPNNKLDVAIAWRMSWNCQNLKQMANKVYFWPHDTPVEVKMNEIF